MKFMRRIEKYSSLYNKINEDILEEFKTRPSGKETSAM
jgi:hypothetical protein